MTDEQFQQIIAMLEKIEKNTWALKLRAAGFIPADQDILQQQQTLHEEPKAKN